VSFRLEYLLIVIRVEIASDHNAFDRELCSFNHVGDVRHELSNGDLTFLNVLCLDGSGGGIGVGPPLSCNGASIG
jgi:hypothetical protein